MDPIDSDEIPLGSHDYGCGPRSCCNRLAEGPRQLFDDTPHAGAERLEAGPTAVRARPVARTASLAGLASARRSATCRTPPQLTTRHAPNGRRITTTVDEHEDVLFAPQAHPDRPLDGVHHDPAPGRLLGSVDDFHQGPGPTRALLDLRPGGDALHRGHLPQHDQTHALHRAPSSEQPPGVDRGRLRRLHHPTAWFYHDRQRQLRQPPEGDLSRAHDEPAR